MAGKGGLLQSNQLAMWQEYVRWEASNPQRLESAALVQRVNLAYDQMLIGFAAYPEVCMRSTGVIEKGREGEVAAGVHGMGGLQPSAPGLSGTGAASEPCM